MLHRHPAIRGLFVVTCIVVALAFSGEPQLATVFALALAAAGLVAVVAWLARRLHRVGPPHQGTTAGR